MIIAVNTRLLLRNKLEGIGWFTHETLKRITQQHPEHQFIFFFDRPFSEEFVYAKNVTPVVVSPPTRHYLLWYFWFEWRIPSQLKKFKADLFLSTDGWLSLSTTVKSVNVIHDLNFEHFPQFIPLGFRKYYRYFFPRFARKAARIATVSEYTKNDIATLYGIGKSKIDVVYNGCNEHYKSISENEKIASKAKYTKDSDFFIFVGLIHPRKNLTNLFKAFDSFKKENNSDTKLVIVGQKHWWKGEIENTFEAMQYKNEVIFTGRLEPENLYKLMASALALTYVPFFEGFGIPIIEAFNSDTCVITSNVTSMPEVAKDAALLVNPNSVEEIKNAMLQVQKNPELRKQLILKGRERAKEFSWDKTAQLLWKCITNA